MICHSTSLVSDGYRRGRAVGRCSPGAAATVAAPWPATRYKDIVGPSGVRAEVSSPVLVPEGPSRVSPTRRPPRPLAISTSTSPCDRSPSTGSDRPRSREAARDLRVRLLIPHRQRRPPDARLHELWAATVPQLQSTKDLERTADLRSRSVPQRHRPD